jgi:hypothetical protein
MSWQNKLEITSEFLASLLFAVVVVQFSNLADPWIPILCGAASGFSLTSAPHKIRNVIFGSIACVSILPNSPWCLSQSTLIFGIVGFATSLLIQFQHQLQSSRLLRCSVQFAPLLLITSLMPIVASFRSLKGQKVAFLDGGVWATASQLPRGKEALSTKHQYTYECFRDHLQASAVKPGESLDGIDTLIIVTPTKPFDASYIKAIKGWTSKGGRLLIVADHTNLFGHQTVLSKLTDELGIGIRPDALYETQTNGGVYSNIFFNVAGLTPCSISEGVVPRLRMKGFSEYPDYTATSFFGDLDPTDDDQPGNFPILGSRRYGRGEVSIFSDSTFFANFAIHRWSSQLLLGSLFWSPYSSLAAIVAVLIFICSLVRPLAPLFPISVILVVISPGIGFRPHDRVYQGSIVTFAPPTGAGNESEERDRGLGSSLLASAYAFGIDIHWDKNHSETLNHHLLGRGIQLPLEADEIPMFDVQQLMDGRFFVDRNTFWYGQGVGLFRFENMVNFWKSAGAEISSPGFSLQTSGEQVMIDPNGQAVRHHLQKFSDDWVIIDHRIVARWIPESARWLARKEWQFGPWFDKDLVFEPKN